jgi:RsiW-degrading membrane proteinase PrsW (M82 family)
MVNQNLFNRNQSTLVVFLLVIIIAIPISLLAAFFLRDFFSMTFWELFAATFIGGVSGGTVVWSMRRKNK